MNIKYPLLFTCLLACLAGCSDGGGQQPRDFSITGVAASGSAISQGLIYVACKNGVAEGVTNADGSYAVTVSNGVQPCILKVKDQKSQLEIHSLLESGASVANINPFTELVTANLLGITPSEAFSNNAIFEKISKSKLQYSTQLITNAIKSVGVDAGITSVDPLKISMRARTDDSSGDGFDLMIDDFMSSVSSSGSSLERVSYRMQTLAGVDDMSTMLTEELRSATHRVADGFYARSTELYVISAWGNNVRLLDIDFQNLIVTDRNSNRSFVIAKKSRTDGTSMRCAYQYTDGSDVVALFISEDGVWSWVSTLDFGIAIPKVQSLTLTDKKLFGNYSGAIAYANTDGSSKSAGAYRFEFDSNLGLNVFGCDFASDNPNCSTLPVGSDLEFSCSINTNGSESFFCTSRDQSINLVLYPYMSGSQVSFFGNSIKANGNGQTDKGLVVMTRAVESKLPTNRRLTVTGEQWSIGVLGINLPGFMAYEAQNADVGFAVPLFQSGFYEQVNNVNAESKTYDVRRSITTEFDWLSLNYTTEKWDLNSPTNAMSHGVYYDVTGRVDILRIESQAGWSFEIQSTGSAWFFKTKNSLFSQ
jgi:hypothetical protein